MKKTVIHICYVTTIYLWWFFSPRLLDNAGLWKLPETLVVVVGAQESMEEVLFHPSLRNTINILYVALKHPYIDERLVTNISFKFHLSNHSEHQSDYFIYLNYK